MDNPYTQAVKMMPRTVPIHHTPASWVLQRDSWKKFRIWRWNHGEYLVPILSRVHSDPLERMARNKKKGNIMKNLFPIIVLLLSVACGASVAGTHEVGLADIGYGSDIVLSGQRPFQVFFFPIPAGEIHPAKSYIELSVRLSQALHRNSIIRIEVNNIPVLTLTLGQMQLTEKTLKIPLTQADLVKVAHPVDRAEYLKVTVSGHLTISGGPLPRNRDCGLVDGD